MTQLMAATAVVEMTASDSAALSIGVLLLLAGDTFLTDCINRFRAVAQKIAAVTGVGAVCLAAANAGLLDRADCLTLPILTAQIRIVAELDIQTREGAIVDIAMSMPARFARGPRPATH